MPVIHSVNTDPLAAGLVEEFSVPSWLRTTAWPAPVISTAKTPGEAATTGCCRATDTAPFTVATICVLLFPATSNGTMALIWLAPTYSSGAGIPSKVTLAPASWVVTRPCASSTAPIPDDGPRPLPKILTISPGATAPAWKLAPLTTHPASICGGSDCSLVKLSLARNPLDPIGPLPFIGGV